jgi:hypothetical protein
MSYRAVEVPKTIDLLFKLHKSKSTVASLSAGEWFDLIELGGVPGSTSNQEDPCGGPNGQDCTVDRVPSLHHFAARRA